MKDTDWEILYELHRKPNMTKVAAMLYMTQPSLTKRIHAMEEEFQVVIVHRTPKGLEFTKEGDYLAERAERYLAFMKETRKQLEDFKSSETSTIVIGSSYTFSKYALTDVLLRYRTTHENVSFDVVNESSDLLFRKVLDGTVDVGFIRGDYDGAVNRVLISQNQAYLVTRDPIELEELPHMQRIGYRTNDRTHALLDGWWKEWFDTNPPTEMAVGYIDFAWQVIHRSAGYTCCFLPHCFENELNLCLTPMVHRDGTPVMRNTWFVYPKSKRLDKSLQEFVDYIEKEMAIRGKHERQRLEDHQGAL